jgi:hypothetical protein
MVIVIKLLDLVYVIKVIVHQIVVYLLKHHVLATVIIKENVYKMVHVNVIMDLLVKLVLLVWILLLNVRII